MVLENHRAYNLSHAPHQKITQMLLLDDLKHTTSLIKRQQMC